MPLTPMTAALKKAQAERYAIPLFDVFETTGSEAVIGAVEEHRAPALIGIYSGSLVRPSGTTLVECVRGQIERASAPMSLVLDHGRSLEHCTLALSYGFTGVMYDGSTLPLEENIRNTREAVRAAHDVGVGVEAELGQVGSGADYGDYDGVRKGFTDPALAERFVEETGVDVLAVALGSAHGVYKGEPRLDLDLLAEIRRRVDVPLALHGGSGLSDDQFRSAIEAGISKINIATDLLVTAKERMTEAANAKDASFFNIVDAMREAMSDRCGHYLRLFGAAQRA